MHRLAVHVHRAGPAVPGVAALLHPEPAALAQVGAQALPGRGSASKVARPLTSDSRSSSAVAVPGPSRRVPVRRGSPRRSGRSCAAARPGSPWMSSNHVVRSAIGRLDRRPQPSRRRAAPGNHSRNGRTVDGGDGQREGAVQRVEGADDQGAGAAEPVQRRLPEGGAAGERAGRQGDRAQQFPLGQHLAARAGDEVGDAAPAPQPPSCERSRHTPSSAAVSEIIGPAGSALHRLPPTVAMFQILNEARKARQHCSNSGAAVQGAAFANRESWAIVQVAAISRPPSGAGRSGSQPVRLRSTRRRRCGCGSEKR